MVETRSWSTKYRGELAIHSAAKLPPKWLGASRHAPLFRDEIADVLNCRRDKDDRTGLHVDEAIKNLPFGAVLGTVELVAIEPTELVREILSERERIFGNYEDGRFAWFLKNPRKFSIPFLEKGNRMLWNWNCSDAVLSSRERAL